MKTFYGNYLGVVITGGEKDPEGRGRTQIFVPNIMPALYENWNEAGEDISFEVIGQGLEGQLSSDVFNRLRQILPWAECASPITGASPSYKPNLLDKATETLRNVARVVTDVAKDLMGLDQVPQGDAATNLALSNVIADDKTAALSCGATARNVTMTKLFGYSEAEVRAANGGQRQDGKNWDTVLENLGWQKVAVSSPSQAPPNSMLVYKSDPDLGKSARNMGGGTYGHIEYKGVNADGNPAYYYGRGMKPNPGGSVPDNFTGFAYIPPPDRQAKALQNAGLPTVSPSALSHPSPVTGMPSDPTQEGNLNTDYNQQIASGQDFSSLQGSAPETANQSFGSIDGASRIDTSNMSPAFKAQYERVLNNMEGSKFVGTVPKDGKTYGITTGSKEEWAHFFTRNASVESSFNPNTSADINGLKKGSLTSFGLYQMGSTQFNRHGGGNIYNPDDNTKAYLNYAESMYFDNTYKSGGQNVIGGKKEGGGWLGLAAGYGPIRRITTGNPNSNEKQLLAENISAAETQKGTYTAANLAAQPSTHTPTPHQGISGPNTNNQALGMFGYASEGQAVWVFFREGDPLSPVYFAASYGQKEWGNMYQYNSPLGVGAGDGGALPGTEAMALNTYGGGLRSAISTEESPLGSNFSFQLYDKNGSNLSFLTDHTEFNSMYNHVSRVLGDNHDICEANKEVRVRGDFNKYVEQDLIITVGNWSSEAIAASDEIQQYINEAMKIKTAAGGGGSSSGGEGTKSTSSVNKTSDGATQQKQTPKPETVSPSEQQARKYEKTAASLDQMNTEYPGQGYDKMAEQKRGKAANLRK